MSKIEEYKQAAFVASTVKRAVHLGLGRDGPSNDKHEIVMVCAKLQHGGYTVGLRARYGYFGDSSSYDLADHVGFADYLCRAINANIAKLADQAVALAAADAEKARLAAQEEASAVLAETKAAT